jgi:hypothetical protein
MMDTTFADFQAITPKSWQPSDMRDFREITVVGRPDISIRLKWELWCGYWYHESQTRLWYWCASTSVANQLKEASCNQRGAIARRLNAAVIAAQFAGMEQAL